MLSLVAEPKVANLGYSKRLGIHPVIQTYQETEELSGFDPD